MNKSNKKKQSQIQNKSGNLTRSFDLAVKAFDEEKRTVDLSFSSEQPYKRYFGMEILSHDPGAINLSRLQEIGILLFNHNSNIVLGKILSVSIDNVGNRGIATVQFDDDDQAETIFKKVVSGTLKGVSVGYRVDVWEEVTAGSTSKNGRVQGPASIAAKWTPYEISIVSIPADDSVGVGRDMEDDDDIDERQEQAELLRLKTSNTILFNLGGKC